MTPPSATEAPKPAEPQQVRRGPSLLVRIADIRRLDAPWFRTEDIVELFRDAQRIGR